MSVTIEKTYTLHTDDGRIYGYSEGKECVEQQIYKILSTERYEYEIYSDNYGSEFSDLFGKPKAYVLDEIEGRIKDALSQDERILEVCDFKNEITETGVDVMFTVRTNFGNITVTKEISV